jgi:hypothetical protein
VLLDRNHVLVCGGAMTAPRQIGIVSDSRQIVAIRSGAELASKLERAMAIFIAASPVAVTKTAVIKALLAYALENHPLTKGKL